MFENVSEGQRQVAHPVTDLDVCKPLASLNSWHLNLWPPGSPACLLLHWGSPPCGIHVLLLQPEWCHESQGSCKALGTALLEAMIASISQESFQENWTKTRIWTLCHWHNFGSSLWEIYKSKFCSVNIKVICNDKILYLEGRHYHLKLYNLYTAWDVNSFNSLLHMYSVADSNAWALKDKIKRKKKWQKKTKSGGETKAGHP